MMKKITLIMVLAMCISVFAGCNSVKKGTESIISSGSSEITSASTDSDSAVSENVDSAFTSMGDISLDSSFSESSASVNSIASSVVSNSGSKPTTAAYMTSKGKTYQNMTFSYQAVKPVYNLGNDYKVQDLGKMQLESFPIDGVYDTAYNIIKMGDTYKMWWVRACPYDTVWYAESKDLKNWYNEQMVIKINKNTKWVKAMLSWPTVVYINGKYYMWFEAPCEIAESGEYGNNIFFATSKDGKSWTMYPNNSDPQPVLKSPVIKEGVYGVGQPKVYYKDGYFNLSYTDATGSNCTKVARSKNGYQFEGTVATHTKIINVAGASIRYNTNTKKYYCTFSLNSSLFNVTSEAKASDYMYIMESSDGVKWPCTDIVNANKNLHVINDKSELIKRSNTDFVTNEQGLVTTQTMYFVNMTGVMPSAGLDHRVTHTTWDGHFTAINPKEYFNKDIILPNGNKSTATNLKAYSNRVFKWVRPTVNAKYGKPLIDGTMDSGYGKSESALVESLDYNWMDCEPTDTTANVKFMWDNDFLYVFANVKDKKVSYSAVLDKPGNAWRKDSLDFFVDVPNTMEGGNGVTLTPMSIMANLSADGLFVVKDNRESVISSDFASLKTKVKMTSTGYVIEAAIPWYYLVKDMIKDGKTIGLDMAINDDPGVGARKSIVCWSDYSANAFQYLDRYGQVKLIK